jgi:tRNA dimethylallyltransferase
LAELKRWTDVLDPERAHLGRTQLLRAIEVAIFSGQRLSDLHRTQPRPARRTARYLVVDPGALLADRIAARLDAMLAGGWVDEVRRLIESVPEDAPAWNATGYKAIGDYVRGTLDLDEARGMILIATRQYAKRQRTWLRNQLSESDVTHLNPLDRSWSSVAEEWLAETIRRSA